MLGPPLREPPLPLQTVSSSPRELQKAGWTSLQTLVHFAALCVQHPEEDYLIFVFDNTVKLLELSVILSSPLFMLLVTYCWD